MFFTLKKFFSLDVFPSLIFEDRGKSPEAEVGRVIGRQDGRDELAQASAWKPLETLLIRTYIEVKGSRNWVAPSVT